MKELLRKVFEPMWAAWNAGSAEVVATPLAGGPLAALLTRHIVQDGEVILLILKPSVWYIALNMLKWAAFVFIIMIASVLFDDRLPGASRVYLEVGIVALAGRLMWSVLQWMSRLYILTDLRIVTIWGVFTHDIAACPLRKLARTRILRSTGERLLGLGSIEIIPLDDQLPIGIWQTVSRPIEINEQIVAAMNRAKQGMPDLR